LIKNEFWSGRVVTIILSYVGNIDFICLGDISVHNCGIRSNGTGSGREAFTVAQRFRSPFGIHQVQGQYTAAMTTTLNYCQNKPWLGQGLSEISCFQYWCNNCFDVWQPFTLNTPDRHWIFAGDLSRVEGRSVRSYWALLFSDILLFTKVSRDRVLFVTDEPLPLSSIAQTQFSVKKKGKYLRQTASTYVVFLKMFNF